MSFPQDIPDIAMDNPRATPDYQPEEAAPSYQAHPPQAAPLYQDGAPNPQPPPGPGGGQTYAESAYSTQFDDRVGIHQFQTNCKEWGYVAQLHEWASKEHKPLVWVVTRVGGQAHQPIFEAYPVCKCTTS